jgi:hypothetical protein
MPTPTEPARIERLERAVNGLAYLMTRHAAIPVGLCRELDEIRQELAGSVGRQETRPHKPPESRAV